MITSSEIYSLSGHHEEFLSMKGTYITGPHKVRVIRWSPKSAPVGVILVSHGLYEHGLRYCGIAKRLLEENYVVYAMDHYAHGKSDGEKGLITDYYVLLSDFEEVGSYVKEQHPDLPMGVLAHSMGTIIALLSNNRMPYVKCLLLSAIPLFPGPAASSPFGIRCLYPLSQGKGAERLSAVMSFLAPRGPCCPLELNSITSDEEERRLVTDDDLRYHGPINNKTAYEVTKMVNIAKLTVYSLTTPFHCIHGCDDDIAYPHGSNYVVRNAATYFHNREITLFENCRHEVLHESVADVSRAHNLIISYFNEKLLGKVSSLKDFDGVGEVAVRSAADATSI